MRWVFEIYFFDKRLYHFVDFNNLQKGLDCYIHLVENKFFTSHDFISLAARTTSTLSWILGKSILKPKRVHIHKMMLKHMVQNSWQYNLIKAHSSSSWHNISFSAHDPSSWVSSGEFWELWFGWSRSMFC